MRRELKNKKGFTLIEMIVVMGITSLLILLSFQGYFAVKENMYIQELGVRFQYEARNAFVNGISTTAGTSCDALGQRAPKLWVLRVPLVSDGTFRNVQLIAYCENDDAATRVNFPLRRRETRQIDLSDNLTYSRGMESYLTQCLAASNYSDGYALDSQSGMCKKPSSVDRAPTVITSGTVYLIYNTPYGDFFSYWDRTDTSNGMPPAGTDKFNDNFMEAYWTNTNSPSNSYEPPSSANIPGDIYLNGWLSPLDSNYMIGFENPDASPIRINEFVYKSGGVELR